MCFTADRKLLVVPFVPLTALFRLSFPHQITFMLFSSYLAFRRCEAFICRPIVWLLRWPHSRIAKVLLAAVPALLATMWLAPANAAELLAIDRLQLRTHGMVEFSYVDGHPTGISYPDHLQRDGDRLQRCEPNQSVSHADLLRSAWVWQSTQLLADPKTAADFMQRTADAGITRLFVQVHSDLAGFPALFALARARHISLFALGGDPELVQNPAAALAIVDRVLAYNTNHADKFAGIQFDIEPHALPAYRNDPGALC